MIDVFEIEARHKDHVVANASPGDFSVRAAGGADPSTVITDPSVSLYCFDHAAGRALFVRVPQGVDVTAAPFLYMAQYENARQVLSVPYETFHRIAAGLEAPGSLVFIYTTGRAGSTLLSKAFQEMGAATSLSEPDVYSQAVAWRLAGEDGHEIQSLLHSATKILFHRGAAGRSSINVVKFRSYCVQIGDLLTRAFPGAGSLFLYRDLAATIRSYSRLFGHFDARSRQDRRDLGALASMCPLLARELESRDFVAEIEVITLMCLSTLHGYARLHEQGVPILPVRYEELRADPTGMLTKIFTYLRLPNDEVERALRAFARDSQAGSPLAREELAGHASDIDRRSWELVDELVRRYPIGRVPIPAATFSSPVH
ncbi:MAG TPA: sulfotransferase [Chloroflexota bacterium]|nr:sulfotransferase [Chloroflexota bacterium]